ncbi:MAG: TRAP transporter small permease [Clostridiales bacterium]|nr:TRAP transporter small permease [Clostridiales bacterium]
MKIYKRLMNILAFAEKIVLVLAFLLILVITVGNVFSRYVVHNSWSFTEELVIAVFVLITFLAAALACREGGLVSLSLFTDMLPVKSRKIMVVVMTVLSVIFTAILFKYGLDKVLTQLENGKRTFVLNWPEWIFWSFVPIGAACMLLHFIEYCIDYCAGVYDGKENRKQ